MKRKEINGYQPKELIVADIIAYLKPRQWVRIIDLNIRQEVFANCAEELKFYPSDKMIQSILSSEVSFIDSGHYIQIYINSSDIGKFDIEYLLKMFEDREPDPRFFDQMAAYHASCIKANEDKSLKKLYREFKELAKKLDVDINMDYIKNRIESGTPINDISKGPGESYMYMNIPRDIRDIPPMEFIKDDVDNLKVTVVKRRDLNGGNNNDNK